MKLKPGTVVTLKLTEEPVFILGVKEDKPEYPGFSGVLYLVKRPLLTQEGVKYTLDYFMEEELISVEERRTKKIEEMEELKARFAPAGEVVEFDPSSLS